MPGPLVLLPEKAFGHRPDMKQRRTGCRHMRRGTTGEAESVAIKAAAFAQVRDPACDAIGVRKCLFD